MLGQRKGQKIPSAPAEGWLSNGRRVLHFQPAIWNQWQQELEITSGQLLPHQPVPLLQRRMRLSRDRAVELWRQRLAEGSGPPESLSGAPLAATPQPDLLPGRAPSRCLRPLPLQLSSALMPT